MIRLSPSVRITTGLVSLMVCLVLILDLFFGLLPGEDKGTQEIREKVSTSLAAQLTPLIQANHVELLRATLNDISQLNKDILSVAVRRQDGEVIAQAGNHSLNWVPLEDGLSTLTHVSVPINAGSSRWGHIEISYQPTSDQGLLGWLQNPLVVLLLAIIIAGSIFFYLYMRRVLQYLDPSQVISERVSSALDTLTEGVVILDLKGRIMLANHAFSQFHPQTADALLGRSASDLDWLKAGLDANPDNHPWTRVLRNKQPVTREAIEIHQENGNTRKLMVNVAPVLDDYGKLRGCLATFDDVTQVEHMNNDLRRLVDELRISQSKIESQNVALQILANHDQLTGCYNRRVFFEQGERIFREAHDKGLGLCCIMADIDFFKSVNDTYGHPVGDQVIKLVAKFLQSSVRPTDLLCRYGGEEFCLLLPNLDWEGALQIADRIRNDIEENCGRGIRDVKDLRITSSFGVGSIGPGVDTLAELINQADQGLYGAKRTGRNRVFLYKNLKDYQELAATEGEH